MSNVIQFNDFMSEECVSGRDAQLEAIKDVIQASCATNNTLLEDVCDDEETLQSISIGLLYMDIDIDCEDMLEHTAMNDMQTYRVLTHPIVQATACEALSGTMEIYAE